jgi:hypothetical protein
MSIHYALFENHLTTDRNDYSAKVSPVRVVELNEVINRMVERGSTVTRPDILSVMDDFQEALQSLLEEGSNVNLPFANYSMSIKGVFDGQNDTFDSHNHQIMCRLHPGRDLKKFIAGNVSAIKEETIKPSPNLIDIIDVATGERNSILTPGNMGTIIGSRLKFNADSADEGIYFIDESNTESKAPFVGKNKPGELMFLIPENLTAGSYTLEVRASFGDLIRSGQLSGTLQVA